MSVAELAYEGAKRVIEEHDRMLLGDRNRDAFLAAVRKPPPPKERLRAAVPRHDRLTK